MDISRRAFNLSAFGAVGLSAAGLAACSRHGGMPENKTLTFAQAQEPATLNMAITSAGPGLFIASKIQEGLLNYDESGRPLPHLATRWSVDEEGLAFRFDLRPDVRWHDGKPFTSRDVAFSLLNGWKAYHSRGRTVFANVVSVDSSDPLKVVIHLSTPAPYLLYTLQGSEYPIIPEHLFAGSDVRSNPYNVKPVGTGPFRFVSWDSGSQVIVERNPDYWDKSRPHLDRIVTRFLPDAAATVAALETGTVDLGPAPWSDVARLRRENRLNVFQAASSFLSYLNIDFNLDRPSLRDVRVRRAIAHAIDRAFLAKVIAGDALVATGIIPPGIKDFYETDLPSYPFDLAKAAALLDEAGLKPGPDGKRLTLFLDSASSTQNVRIGSAIRSNFAKIGVVLHARVADQAEYINRVFTRRDFDLSLTPGGTGSDPAIGIQRLYWSKSFVKGVAFSNGAGYVNPRVDQLLEAAQVELDLAKRKRLYHEFQEIVMTELPVLPLYWSRGGYLGANKRVSGLKLGRFGVSTGFGDVRV